MKIGILTLALYGNYGGGLLQAYALQRTLQKLGHDPVTVDYLKRYRPLQYIRMLMAFLIKKYLFRRKGVRWRGRSPTTAVFIRNRMKMTKPIYAPATLMSFRRYGFEAFVVGSDQCWRNEYVPFLPTYFLDFLCDDKSPLRVAYAASFGKDEWNVSPALEYQCAQLAKKFNMISVREDSAIDLCQQKLGVFAEQVLDPTFLLSKEEYEELIDFSLGEGECPVGAYILDVTSQKDAVISSYAKIRECRPLIMAPERERYEADVPSVSRFVSLFKKSQCIITDSFHGMVFSLIFEKPFLVIANKQRGLARFESLLGSLGLKDRLVAEDELCDARVQEVLGRDVDWDIVKETLSKKRDASIEFLKKSLNGK